MGQRRSLRTFLAMFLIIFMMGIGIEVFSQVINSLRATNVSQLVVDNNNNGLADGGDVIQYTVQIANCSGTSIGGVNYQSDLDPNTSLVPNSVQVTTSGTSLCGDTSTPVDPPPPPPPPPVNPIVTTTTPADADTEVALNTNLTITFSEAVTVTGDWVEMACTLSGTFNPVALGNLVVTGGPITYTLDPNVDLQVGETCAVTVYATGVVDTEGLSPLANFAFSFVTETPPTVTTTTPANGAVGVATTDDIVITFDEPVNVTAASFTLECPATVTFVGGFAVSGSGTSIITVNPTGNLPAGTPCQVVIIAANTTDLAGNNLDGNGDLTPGDDYTFSFTTDVDAAPFVTTIDPADGAVSVPNTTNITITFSELVNITSAADFNLECGGNPQGYTITTPATLPASTTTVVIDPAGNLPDAETCTVTVFTTVTDTDLNDPPNNMAANFVSTFTTEAPPAVTTTTPADLATGVPTNANIVVNFDEPVNVSLASFTIVCTNGGNRPFTFTGDGTNSITLDPATNLQANDSCTVTVVANQVSDVDPIDPPNNMVADYVFSFDTVADTAPTVLNTTPADLATGVPTNSNIVINFSEPVDITAGAFNVTCLVGPAITFTVIPALPTTNQTSITLDPTGNLPAGTSCTVDVASANVTDTDTDEPPDNMVADYQFSFDTIVDLAPTASSPLDGATNVATASNIVINFSEPVDVTAGAFAVECPVGTPVTFTVIPALPTTNQTSITLDPTVNLPATTTCVVTVLAANVTDTDTDEPPDNMAANYVFTFDTLIDLAPTVNQAGIAPASTTTGANSASLNNPVSTTPTITIPFSESVDLLTGAFTLNCGAPVGVTVAPALPATNTSFNISPTAPLTAGANCVLTVVSALVSDTDTDDPPNLMVTDFTLSFSVDTAPAETLTETEVGGVFQDVTGAGATNVDLDSDIRISFNEAVNVIFPANGLQCPAGNNIPVTVTTNNATTIVLNPNVNLPLNTACVLNIPAGNISDVDTADLPDNPVAGVNHTFQTANDTAPTVTTNPADGGANIAVNGNITVTFSEPVTLTGGWFALNCSVSGNRISTGELTGTGIIIIENTPDLVYTIDPTVDFGAGDVCTITINSALVVDNDLIDPPNELDGDNSGDVTDGDADDYVATFSTTDIAPSVISTTPLDGVTVASNQAVTINFSELVSLSNVPGTGITWVCNASPITYTVGATANITSITLTPTAPTPTLPNGSACTVTVNDVDVSDDDLIDPPNNMLADFVLNFTVDAQPTVVSTQVEVGGVLTPASGATNVDLDTNIVVTFSEPVTVTLASFDLECPALTDIAFTIAGSGTNTITIDPTPAILPINTLCDLDIIAVNVSDVDVNDPPDNMPADVNVTFTTVNDNPPSVTSAEAEVSDVFTALSLIPPTFADADTDLRITFSEAVTVTGNWASLNCTASGVRSVGGGTLAVTDADPVYTLNPTTNLTPGEGCTLTIFGANVTDDDAIDPPDTMTADAVFTFVVLDTPPQVLPPTTPINGATVANNQTVTIPFTENVNIAAGGITWTCNAVAVPFTPALPQNNVNSITLTPTGVLPNGQACVVTLVSTLITDVDPADPPNELDGNFSNDIIDGDADNFVLNFTVDAPPQVTTITVEVAGVPSFLPLGGAQRADVDTNINITFTESINATVAGVTLDCGFGPVPFAGLPVANNTSITVNPTSDLPGGATCTITMVFTEISDNDTFDPPNLLDGNYDLIEGPSIAFTFTTQSLANDDAYTVTPHLTYNSPTGVRANDNPNTVTITGFGNSIGTANGTAPNGINSIVAGGAGGTVVMNADGTFTFFPDAGDNNASGVVTFFYTITGGDTAQVTLTFEAEEFVWFVDGAGGACTTGTGTNVGTQACPATDMLGTVTTNDTANDIIFIADGNYGCGITLEAGQWVIGDGSSSTLAALVASRVTPVAGSDFAPYNTFSGADPVLNAPVGNCFTLSTNNDIRGLRIDNTAGSAIASAFNIGTSAASEVNITGTGGILNLTGGGTFNGTFETLTSTSHTTPTINLLNMAGTITNTGGTITNNVTADLISVGGGSINMTLLSTASKTGGFGSLIVIGGGHTGTLTFEGAVSQSSIMGTGIQLNNADGTYTFNGDVDLLAGTAGVNIQTGSAGTVNISNAASNIQNINGISFRINNSTANVTYAGDIIHNSQANRGIEIIQGTGTISFSNALQIGTVANPMLSAEGVFLEATGAANPISFANLNIITGTGGGAGSQAFVSQTSGRIAVTTGSIDCNGNLGIDNHCFDVSNTTSSGVTFASLLSDHDDLGENGGAIFLNNTPGTFTFLNTPRLTGVNAVIVQATDFGTLNIGTTSTGNMETSNRPVFNIENGAINLNATLIRSTDSATHGVRLVNLSGTGVNVTGTTTIDLTPAATGNGILMQNITAGTYNFSTASTVTITDRTNEGIFLNNVDGGAVAFGNTTINNPTAAPEAAVRAENGTSSVTFAQANINQGNIGTHEAFSLDGFTPNASTGEADAIYFINQTGGLTINGGTIQNVSDDGIDIRNSTGLVLNNVTITNTGLNPASDCVGCNSSGVQGFNLIGTVTVSNSTFSNGRIRNFFISNTAGALTFTLNTSTFDDTRTLGVGTDNLQMYLGGTSSSAIDINGGTFTRSRTNQIEVTARDTATVTRLDITGITMNNLGGDSSGISINGLGNSTIAFNVANNPVLYSQDENVITISAGPPGGNAVVQGRINNNPDMRFNTDSTGSSFGIVRMLSDGANSALTVLIENNTMTLNDGTTGIGPTVQGTGSARMDATIINNNINATGTVNVPLDAINAFSNPEVSATKFLCVDVTDNDVTGIWLRSFRIRQFQGTVQLEGFAVDVNSTWLARGNTGLPTGTTGVIGAGTCNMPTNPLP